MTVSISRLSAALLTACTLFAAVPAHATNQSEQRQDARDIRQDTRQESRDAKQEGRDQARDVKY